MRAFLLLLMFGLSGAWADESDDATDMQVCQQYFSLAESVMELRQLNYSMPEAMAIADGEPLAERLIVSAYDLPAYSAESNQQRAIKKFANDAYSQCYKVRIAK